MILASVTVPPHSEHPAAERRRLLWPVLLGALGLVLLGAAVVLGLQVRSDVAGQTARTDATEAAEQQAVNVTGISSSDAAAGIAEVLDSATGAFRTAFASQSAELEQSVRDQQVTSTSRVIDSGVVDSRAGSAVVVVVVEATVANRAMPAPSARRYRLQLGLAKVDSRWMTSSFEVLG